MDIKKIIFELRTEIDKVDAHLFELLLNRFELSDKLISNKIKSGLNVFDPKRETEIISLLKKKFSDKINADFIVKFIRLLLNESKKRANASNYPIINSKMIISGPCVVESEEQINKIAEYLFKLGIEYLRGGTFKPRTSPHSFMGLGDEGVDYLHKAAHRFGMKTVTEILDIKKLEEHYDKIDVVQIGSRNMSSFGLLKEIGKITAADSKPVILKRGFSATMTEFLLAADYILNEGNKKLILCLRGIRTFEQIDSELRNTPDLASILELKRRSNLKVLFDPSHSTGNAKYVRQISKAAIDLGADGLLIETHFDPARSMIDAKQTISLNDFAKLLSTLNLKGLQNGE